MFRKIIPLFLFLTLINISCRHHNPLEVDLTKVEPPDIHIKRYEKVLFAISKDSIRQGLNNYRSEFPFFIGDAIDTLDIINLANFITDPTVRKTYDDVVKMYPDLESIEKELNKALHYFKYYFPDIRIKDVYTYISGFDFEHPVTFTDSVFVIGIDMYMGSGYFFYPMLGIPEYKTYRMRRENITVDCMSELARQIIPLNSLQFNFLERMIYEGKLLYFLDMTMPLTDDTLKIGFKASQLEWCQKNEKNIWGFFMGQDLLYSSDRKVIARFMDDGPYTPSFAAESPARTGAYIGWQIIRSFMENTETAPPKLFAINDAQAILKKSKYKPKNK